MKKTFRILVALFLVGGWALAASALHVVWTGSNVIVIPKNHIGLTDTYVNITNWTPDDVSNHPNVSKRLVETDKAEALSPVFKTTNHEELTAQIQEAANRGPTSRPSPGIAEKVQEMAHQATQVVQH